MTNLTDVSQWDAGVYQFATTDPIQGGPGGIDNQPHQSLGNRSLWLRNRMAAAITQAGLTDGTSDNTQMAQAIVLHCATVPALRLVPIPVVPNAQTVFIVTRGLATESDGLGTAYKWIYNSAAVDDGVSIIRPSSLPALGRWVVCGFNASALGGQGAGFYAGAAATAAALALKAPLLSPNFTGTPTAPNPPVGDRDQSLATTQFVNDDFLSKAGIALTWNNNPNTYYKIATLPATTAATADSINIRATLNVGYTASSDTIFDGILGNRGGFSYVYNLYGPNNGQTSIQGYLEADGSVSIYAVSTATFAYAYISICNIGQAGITWPPATLYPVPAATTVPTGTLNFASGNTTAYPPYLWVSAPGSYLTAAIAAATYLPLIGGSLSGDLTVNADLHVYRGAGTTGVMFLNVAQTAYVYWDGTKYNMPTGEIWANGFQLARLASPAFTGTPSAPTPATTDNDVSIAPTAFVKAVVAAYAPLASPALTGNPTAPTPVTTDADTSIATTGFVKAAFTAGMRGGTFACASGLPGTRVNFSPAFTTLKGLVVCGGPLAGQFQTCSLLAEDPTGFTATSSFNGGTCSYLAWGL